MWDAAEFSDIGWVLEISWPKDRGLFLVWYDDESNLPSTCLDPVTSAWVFADCAGDAVEALAEFNGHEGDDDCITFRAASADEWARVQTLAEAWLAGL